MSTLFYWLLGKKIKRYPLKFASDAPKSRTSSVDVPQSTGTNRSIVTNESTHQMSQVRAARSENVAKIQRQAQQYSASTLIYQSVRSFAVFAVLRPICYSCLFRFDLSCFGA